jgi:hypothetical protein
MGALTVSWKQKKLFAGWFLSLLLLLLLTGVISPPPRDFLSVAVRNKDFLLDSQAPSSLQRSAVSGAIAFSTDPQRKPQLRVVFVGDSLSRYMYLSLVYYLKHGTWAPSGHQLLEKVKDPKPAAWNEWLMYTHEQLDTELCDCYRYWTHAFKWYNHCENRYFFDQRYHVAFITKFGGNPFHGHVSAPEVFSSYGINQTKSHYKWVHSTWDALVHDYIAHWNPKPDIFLFNQGHWKGHELRDKMILEALRDALQKHKIRGVYRTTTYRQDEREGSEAATIRSFRNRDTRQHDALVCHYFECLNVSWTAGISTTEYVDPVHFKASVNNRMNVQFLEDFAWK